MAIFKNLKKALTDPLGVTTLNLKLKTDQIPEQVSSFKNLEALYLSSKDFIQLDFPFDQLEQLKVLYIQSEKLQEIPENILTHPKLQTLSLSSCSIQTFCLSAGASTQVKTLMLNKNKLTDIPKNLEHIESLECLNLSDNQLTSLPTKLRHLVHLKSLSLNRNQLVHLPIELIKGWKSLHSLALDGNLFDASTKTLIEQELNYWFGEL